MSVSDSKQSAVYPDISHEQLDADGEYYARHVAAMTAEGLHAKSAIASQLGARDRRIDELEDALRSVLDVMHTVKFYGGDGACVVCGEEMDGHDLSAGHVPEDTGTSRAKASAHVASVVLKGRGLASMALVRMQNPDSQK